MIDQAVAQERQIESFYLDKKAKEPRSGNTAKSKTDSEEKGKFPNQQRFKQRVPKQVQKGESDRERVICYQCRG
jgi:hypothetical protein